MRLFIAGIGIAVLGGISHLLLLIVLYLIRNESIMLTSRGWEAILISFGVMLAGVAITIYAWLRKW